MKCKSADGACASASGTCGILVLFLNKKRPAEAVTIANTRIENLLSDSEDDMP